MEISQKLYIRTNLAELLRQTTVNKELIAELHAKCVLSDGDVEMLTYCKYESGNTAAASFLYQIVVTRTDAYKLLLTALNKTCQTVAAKILEDGPINGEKATATCNPKETKADTKAFEVWGAVKAIKLTPSFNHLIENWYTLALQLNTEPRMRDNLGRLKNLGLIEPDKLLYELLDGWEKKGKTVATVEKLCKILTDCKFTDAANALRQNF